MPRSRSAIGAPSPRREVEEAAAEFYCRKRPLRAQRLGCRLGVVGGGVRQDDRMGLGVGQVEAAAEGVAELVVQRHADGAEHGAAEPRAVERVARAPPGRAARRRWRGSASLSARMPSTAISEVTGLRSRA